MTYPSKNQGHKIESGSIVIGKWDQKQYQIIKALGFGAQGTVYLAQGEEGKVALKFGNDNTTITSEVNVLKRLAKAQGDPLGPSLYDVDDWLTNKGTLSFYAMEYFHGTSLLETVRSRGFEWAPIFILQMLTDLGRFHAEDLVFGDLKPENLLVTGPRLRVRWLDVGGVTQIGRSIKEYTEFYDRGFWGMGTRKADPAYDLFALTMIFIQLATQKRFEKSDRPARQLKSIINQSKRLAPFQAVLMNALEGKYKTADEMRHDFVKSMNAQELYKQVSYTHDPKKRHKEKRGWKGTAILGSVIGFAYFMYVTLFIM